MKTRNLLLTGLISLGMLTACSNDEELGTAGNQDGENGTAYVQLAITIANDNTAMTKAAPNENTGDDVYGDYKEYAINDVQVIGVNSSTNKIAWIENISKSQMETIPASETQAQKLLRATKPFGVPTGSYRIYVIANAENSDWKFTDSDKGQEIGEKTISENSKLSEDNTFVMTNSTTPAVTIINESSSKTTEFDDNGEAKSGDDAQQVIKVEAELQRVVGKIQFTGTTTFDTPTTIGENFSKVVIEGVYIVNLNKKMNLIMDSQLASSAPGSLTKAWYYPKDPNYDTAISSSTTNDWYDANFSSSIQALQRTGATFPTFSSYATNDVISYVPENTMNQAAQQIGQTTGVLYKATITIANDKYSSLNANGGNDESDMYQKICEASDTDIPSKEADLDKIFTTRAQGQDVATFYTFNNYIFISKKAAAMYQAIVTSSSNATPANVYAKYTANQGDDNKLIKEYKNGASYYYVGIKHNPDLDDNEEFKYGVVRNHWYVLEVNSINALGYTEDEIKDDDVVDPEDPVDPVNKEVAIQVRATIKQWRLVKQGVDL